MMFKDMCPYYTPCGFCIKYDKLCKEVCEENKKIKNSPPKPDLNIHQKKPVFGTKQIGK